MTVIPKRGNFPNWLQTRLFSFPSYSFCSLHLTLLLIIHSPALTITDDLLDTGQGITSILPVQYHTSPFHLFLFCPKDSGSSTSRTSPQSSPLPPQSRHIASDELVRRVCPTQQSFIFNLTASPRRTSLDLAYAVDYQSDLVRTRS